jgi:hypothetical protein
MKLAELEHAIDLLLPSPSILYRVQRLRSRRGAVPVGPLRVPMRGLLLNRFDLVDDEAAYFADSSETAIYETLARREAVTLSLSVLAGCALLTLQTKSPLNLLDLRFHVGAWPVLQSLRYTETQELAAEARAASYDGLIYRSAQQDGSDCIVLFGASAMRSVKLVSKLPLLSSASALHRAAARAVRGAKVPLTP